MSSYLIRTTNGDRVLSGEKVRDLVAAGKIPPATKIRDQATGKLVVAGEVGGQEVQETAGKVGAPVPETAGKAETVKALPAWSAPALEIQPAEPESAGAFPPEEAEPTAPPVAAPATGRAVRTATARTTRVASGKTVKPGTGRIARDPAAEPGQERPATGRIGRKRKTPWPLFIACGLAVSLLATILVWTLCFKSHGPQIVGHWDLDVAKTKEANRTLAVRKDDELKELDALADARSGFAIDFTADGKMTITLGDQKRHGTYEARILGPRKIEVVTDFPAPDQPGNMTGPATAAAPITSEPATAAAPVAGAPATTAAPVEGVPATAAAPTEGQGSATEAAAQVEPPAIGDPPAEGQESATAAAAEEAKPAAEGEGSATAAATEPAPAPKKKKKKAEIAPPPPPEPEVVGPATPSFKNTTLSFFLDGDRMQVLDVRLYMIFNRRK